MYELTILCIMRNSLGYMDRFLSQVNYVFQRFEPAHLIICEGDSDDGTKQRLAQIAAHDDDTVHGDVTVVELDTGKPLMGGNVNHPSRWWTLEVAWNECIKHLEPTKYAVCVESDLIWSPDVLSKMIAHLDAGKGDVLAPMLMRENAITGKYFYDTNGDRLHGINFSNYPPYHPEWDDNQQFMQLDVAGGMLVMKGETLNKATWKDQCTLHYAEGTKVVLDTRSEILHP